MPYIDEAFISALKEKLGDAPASESCSSAQGSFYEEEKECDSAGVADTPIENAVGVSGESDDSWVEVYKKIQRLAAVSERSTKGLRDRFTREGFAADDIERALERACSFNIIDDMRYAESLVRGRLAAGKGRRGIESELRALDIDPDLLENWNDFESGETEVERALAVLEKKPPRAKNKREAAYRRLIMKGYSSSAAQTAARIWSESA